MDYNLMDYRLLLVEFPAYPSVRGSTALLTREFTRGESSNVEGRRVGWSGGPAIGFFFSQDHNL